MNNIEFTINDFPERYHNIIDTSAVSDSSSSPDATVYFIDNNEGLYLKKSARGALYNEYTMTDYFYKKGLSPAVVDYYQDEFDWMLTKKAVGHSCIHPTYISDPTKLVDKLAEAMHIIHTTDIAGCPITNRTVDYLATYKANKTAGIFNKEFEFLGNTFESPDAAQNVIDDRIHLLECNRLTHGDFCLPNVFLNNWDFSAVIDVGFAGVGDVHIDIFWAIWTLNRNFGTNEYAKRLIDAYGKDKVNPDTLLLISAIECFG